MQNLFEEIICVFFFIIWKWMGLTNMFGFVSTLLAGLRFLGANANMIYLLLEVWDSYL